MNARHSLPIAALVLLGTVCSQPCFGADAPPPTTAEGQARRREDRASAAADAGGGGGGAGKDAGKPPNAQESKDLRPLHLVLVAGKKDHGKGEHDYPAWQTKWAPMLAKAPGVHVSTAFGRPDDKVWQSADVMVFYCWGPQFWDAESFKPLDAFLARGGGLVIMHSAVIGDADTQGLADRIGFAWDSKGTKYRHGPHDVTFTGGWPPKSNAAGHHPITRGYSSPLHVVDEDYWPILAKTKGRERNGPPRCPCHYTRRRRRVAGAVDPWERRRPGLLHDARPLHLDAGRPARPGLDPAGHRLGGEGAGRAIPVARVGRSQARGIEVKMGRSRLSPTGEET